MEGDSCTKHPDRIATGYYSGSNYGYNGCAECMSNASCVKQRYYGDMQRAQEIFDKRNKAQAEYNEKLLSDDSLSHEVSTRDCQHWVLFGNDKLDFLKDKKVSKLGFSKFQDARSHYYDSGD